MNRSGQTTIELLASLTSVVLTIAVAGWLLKVEWDRGKCAYVVFEQTHAQVSNSISPTVIPTHWGSDVPVQIHNDPVSTQGIGFCGQSTEAVSLPQLDPE